MASKNGYDRVPLVSGAHSDSDDDLGPISYISLKKKRKGAYQKPLILAGVFIILVLLVVIAALCYVLVERPNFTGSNKKTAPSVMEHKQNTTGSSMAVFTTKITEDNRRRQTPNWKVTFDALGSECVMRLLDIDGDGLQDVVFGAASTADLASITSMDANESLRVFCEKTGRGYPCIGTLFGMRGYDGKVLWKIPTRSGSLLNNCEDFDLNLDGHIDCVIGGRSATIEAIDVKNGKRLWEGSSRFFTKTWNFYHPMALPDFNGDGVKEILVMHGGNPNKDSDDHNRESGRLILLDGRTGRGMGVRYLGMPNSKESYQSPVLYTYTDGSQYILFGSGGETIPGDFMMISLPDYYRYVMGLSQRAIVPHTQGSYNQWPHLHRQPETGIIVLFTGVTKGVMVPPLMTDIDHDGIDDIVMSAYDGLVMLLDGRTMTSKWKAEFPGMESYSTPAPGYFDDDDVLDFMVHWSTGAWPIYNSSKKVILNGKDGSVIWQIDMKNYEMSSDLTIQTTEPNRDLYLYKTKGRGAHVYQDVTGEVHGVGVQRNISISPKGKSKMPTGPQQYDDMVYKEYIKFHFQCNSGVDIKSEIFLMDRTTADTPLKILETVPKEYNYHPSIDWKSGIKNESLNFCSLLIPEDRTTSAIGDVDGDGTLDLVTLIGHTAQAVDQHYSYDRMVYETTIHKINLGPILKDPEARVPMKVRAKLPLDRYHREKDISQLQLLPLQQQQWLSYFGTKQNGHFKNKS